MSGRVAAHHLKRIQLEQNGKEMTPRGRSQVDFREAREVVARLAADLKKANASDRRRKLLAGMESRL